MKEHVIEWLAAALIVNPSERWSVNNQVAALSPEQIVAYRDELRNQLPLEGEVRWWHYERTEALTSAAREAGFDLDYRYVECFTLRWSAATAEAQVLPNGAGEPMPFRPLHEVEP